MSSTTKEMEVDDQLENDAGFMDKYSRQIGAFGIETMAKLIKLKVLIVGMQGVGIECAKNLVLAGPGAVTIHDDGKTEMKDLGSNFFLTEQDVGQPRAQAVAHKLVELNKMVTVKVHAGPLTEDLIAQHTVVVFTNTKRDDLIRWNAYCRTHHIGCIVSDTRGAFGYAFTDFGDQFLCHDATGENPITRIITDISNAEKGVVTLLGPDEDGKMHELPDSDHDGWIDISEVEGMTSGTGCINTAGPHRIEFAKKQVKRVRNGKEETVDVFDPHRLLIGDTRHFSPYIGGGMMTQHKKPYRLSFRSFQDALARPVPEGEFGLMFTDGAKFGRAEQLHAGLVGLMEFEQRHGHLPRLHDEDDANEVLGYAKDARQDEEQELDEEVIRTLARYAAAEFHPMSAFFGGVVAQEVVKFTGKFTPLKQWLHLDAFEVLPETIVNLSDHAPLDSRYDHVISMFGLPFHNQLRQVKTFLVGCGALGCEYLKNFAMVGLACPETKTQDGGCVIVTDNDRIEISNLNRQFLFREHNVGQAKSVAATEAVRHMNRHIHVQALEHLVAPQTEHIFDEAFWDQLHVVTNALDNVKARLYVDSKCVYHKKPLLESGTLGTKCNVQVIIPDMTQSYSDGPKDPENDTIPMCTLRNFPSLIEHCIEWARAQFEDRFVVPAADAKKFLSDPAAFLTEIRQQTVDHVNPKVGLSAVSQELDRMKALRETLTTAREITFEKCVDKAFELFHLYFRDRILQLIHTFPQDHVTKTGDRFWTGAKRFPQAATFDPSNPTHLSFLISTTNLFAVMYGLHAPPEQKLVPEESKWRNPAYVTEIVAQLAVPMWSPSDERIELEEEEEAAEEKKEDSAAGSNDEELEEFKAILDELNRMAPTGENATSIKCEPADFEKDQDLNFHIDFIYAASNLRASNYRIKNASRHECKMIAGKIIPAIATTTACVTGLAMIEMFKILQHKPLESYKDSSNSLGLNMYLMQEPAPADKAKDEYDVIEMAEIQCRPSGFTKWDRTLIRLPNATLSGFLAAFKAQTGLNCDLLFHHIAEVREKKFQAVSGLMLYDRNAFTADLKSLYQSKMECPLKDWVNERYQGLVQCNASIELQTSCSDDDGNPYKVPRVILYF